MPTVPINPETLARAQANVAEDFRTRTGVYAPPTSKVPSEFQKRAAMRADRLFSAVHKDLNAPGDIGGRYRSAFLGESGSMYNNLPQGIVSALGVASKAKAEAQGNPEAFAAEARAFREAYSSWLQDVSATDETKTRGAK